jgi:hypothetical protein
LQAPASLIADWERVEVAIEDEAPPGPPPTQASEQTNDARLRLKALHFDPWDRRKHTLGDFGHRRCIAWRVRRGGSDQRAGRFDKAGKIAIDLG